MAIQMRRGQLADFDKSQMLPGEVAVSLDNDSRNRKAFITFANGIAKEVAFKNDYNPYMFVDFNTGHLRFGNTENYDFGVDINTGHLKFIARGVN